MTKPSKPSKPPNPPTQRAPVAGKGMTVGGEADGHDGRQLCGAPTRKGKGPPCTQQAGWGTGHVGVGRCKLHRGSTPTHEVAGARELESRKVAAAVTKLGLVVAGTNPIDALQEALDRARADVVATAARASQLDVAGWAQRDAGGKFERPSVSLEIYWQALDRYARISKDCVSLGIAAAAVDVVRREAEQVQTLLQAFVIALGMAWDDEKVRLALVAAIDRLEGAA